MQLQVVIFSFLFVLVSSHIPIKNQRTFSVDYKNNSFLKDGEPFRYISGAFHYFRSHPNSWQKKLRTMRAAGLNTVSTYVEWSTHNPKDGLYDWSGVADLEKFIQLADQEGLLVIFRPGPYICAERDLGGFPYWLLTKYPKIQLRTTDPCKCIETKQTRSETLDSFQIIFMK